MAEIKCCMKKICKITRKNLGTVDKIMYFQCITSLVAINGKQVYWVVYRSRVNSQQIAKNTLKFK